MGGEFLAQSSLLGAIQLPTCQPQIQAVGVINRTFIPVNTADLPVTAKQPTHGPQHQPQEGHPEEAPQNPATLTQLPTPHTSEHQSHPFQVSSRTSIPRLRSAHDDWAGQTMKIR